MFTIAHGTREVPHAGVFPRRVNEFCTFGKLHGHVPAEFLAPYILRTSGESDKSDAKYKLLHVIGLLSYFLNTAVQDQKSQ